MKSNKVLDFFKSFFNKVKTGTVEFFQTRWNNTKEKVNNLFKPKAKVKRPKMSPLYIGLAVVLALYMISMVVPIFWMLLTTIKTSAEYDGHIVNGFLVKNQLWLPKWTKDYKGFTFQNYKTAYNNLYIRVTVTVNGITGTAKYKMLPMFINSIKFSIGSAIAMTVTTLMMGYAAARFRYKFSELIYMFVLVAMALPIVGSLPSEIATAQALGIFDSFIGIWIMRCTFLNTYFLIYYAQFKMIPMDYTEAAKIDGATPFAVMFKIIVPLASSTTAAIFVLNFIALWNDFQIPMIYLPYNPVAAYGMYKFINEPVLEITSDTVRLAGVCLVAFPIVVFYAIFNKKLNVNLSVGGIKG